MTNKYALFEGQLCVEDCKYLYYYDFQNLIYISYKRLFILILNFEFEQLYRSLTDVFYILCEVNQIRDNKY